jgi:hypothetical protein
LKHEILEKFWLKSESKGWGKGVGRTGGEAGMVGTVWSDVGGRVVVVEAAVADADPVKAGSEADKDPAVDADAVSSGAGRGCRLWGVQSEALVEKVSQFKVGSENISKAAG